MGLGVNIRISQYPNIELLVVDFQADDLDLRHVFIEAQAIGEHYPNPPPAILKKPLHFAVANGEGVERVGREDLETGAIIAVQPVLGGDPEEAVPALQNVEYHALRKPVVNGKNANTCRRLRGEVAGEQEKQQDGEGILHQYAVVDGVQGKSVENQSGLNFRPFSEKWGEVEKTETKKPPRHFGTAHLPTV